MPEEPEPFAEKENSDEREDNDGDERIAAEERLDSLLEPGLETARFLALRDQNAGIGDALHATPSFGDALAPRQRL